MASAVREEWPIVRADYATLLDRSVVIRVLDAGYRDEWRRQIRRKCRHDHVRVLTMSLTDGVYACLRREPTMEEMAEAMERLSWRDDFTLMHDVAPLRDVSTDD